MNKQMQILLAGVLTVVPLAATFWVLWWAVTSIGQLGAAIIAPLWPEMNRGQLADYRVLIGLPVILVLLYVVGWMTRSWLFGGFFRLTDRILSRLPGVRTIYESVRDLLNLFGGDAEKMGKVVLYKQPGTDTMILGIQTNVRPLGVEDNTEEHRVAIYQPFAYMFGGPVFYVPASHVVEIDMSVDQCLKLCATAHVGATAPEDTPAGPDKPKLQNQA
jgi:uncharacterized membrane protein